MSNEHDQSGPQSGPQNYAAGSASIQNNMADAAPWWIREIRQYGVAALVLCGMAWGFTIFYNDQKNERDARVQKFDAVTDKVSSVVTENSKVIHEFKQSVDKNTEATRQLETTVRLKQ